jgi:hypothetical protein
VHTVAFFNPTIMTKYFRVRLIPLMSLVLLGSCINVNNVSSPDAQQMQRHAERIEDQAEHIAQQEAQSNPLVAIEARGATCQLYKLPPLPPVPKKPVAEIQALQDGDEDKLDQIAQTYVRSLERYNITVNRIIQQSYADYLRKCAKSLPPAIPRGLEDQLPTTAQQLQ